MKLKRLLLTALVLTFVATPVFATDWNVGTDPYDDFADLTSAFAFLSGEPGTHTIYLDAGTYTDAGLSMPNNIDAIVGGDGVLFMGTSGNDFMDNTVGTPGGGTAISGLTVDGYDRGIRFFAGTATITDCFFLNCSVRGVSLSGVTGCTVTNNCFIGGGSPQGWDDDGGCGNTWDNNFFDDYTTAGSYALAGGACVDANPQVLAVVPYTAEGDYALGETVDVDIIWNVPDCDVTSALAGYEFTVHTNATKLEFVSAEFDKAYLGVDDGTEGSALYIGPTVSGGDVTFVGVNFSAPGYGTAALAHLKYTVIDANTSVWITVNSDFYDVESNLFTVESNGNLIGLEDNTNPVLTPITAHDPVSHATFSDLYDLFIQFGATDDFDLAEIKYSWDGGGWFTWFGISGLTYDTDPAPGGKFISMAGFADGSDHTLSLKAVDAASNESNVETYSFSVDKTGPTFTFTLEDLDGCGAWPEYTNDSVVLVNMTAAGDPVTMQFWTPDKAYSTPVADYASWGGTFVIDQVEGDKQLQIQMFDAYNNPSTWVTDHINLDMTAPVPDLDFTLMGGTPPVPPGAAKCNTTSITGDVTAFHEQCFVKTHRNQNRLQCDDGGFSFWSHPMPVTLTTGDGVKRIYFAAMDSAGNVSPTQWDEITLDMTAPVIDSIVFAACTDHVNNNDCYVYFSDADVVTVTWQTEGGGYTNFHSPGGYLTSPVLIDVDFGWHPDPTTGLTLDVMIVDDASSPAGNFSAAVGATTDYDNTDPGAFTISMMDKTSLSTLLTNEQYVRIDFSGVATDAVEYRLMQEGGTWGNWIAKDFSSGSATVWNYNFSGYVDCANMDIFAEVRDCAGNVSVSAATDDIWFDLGTPSITAVEVDGGNAETNDVTVSVDITVTGSCYIGAGDLYQLELSTDAGFDPGVTTMYTTYPGPWDYDLPTGDDEYCVYARLVNRAGTPSNEEANDCITLDQTTPTGSFNIMSFNPDASPGYTSGRDVWFNKIDVDSDVTRIRFRNSDPTGAGESAATGWIPVGDLTGAGNDEYDPPGSWLTSWGVGTKTIQMRLEDDALNYSDWEDISDVIYFDPNNPPAPVGLTSTPTASADLDWDDDADVAHWLIRYSFTGDYPTYHNGTLGAGYPMAPTDVTGFPAGFDLVATTSDYEFTEGPHADVYCFSVWAFGKNGLKSTTCATVTGTNYLMGDYITLEGDPEEGTDGCLDFEHEFFNGLGLAYETTTPDPGFDALVDYAAIFGADPMGLPDPDGIINLNDLIVFALNYSSYNCDNYFDPYAKPVASGPVAISAEVPRNVAAGSEFTVSFAADNTAGIFGYRAVFDYNSDILDVVSVEPGEMYASVEQPFFHRGQTTENLDIQSVILGNHAFAGEEMFRVTFKARVSGPVEIEDLQLDFIDADNNILNASFAVSKTVGELPTSFALAQNYPNPFNPVTTVEFSLPVASDYKLTIYNITGQVVESFVGSADAGVQSIAWDAADNSSGIYFYKLEAGTFADTKKMVLLK